MTPRNSQLPWSRLTRLVCLPCHPMPARAASGELLTVKLRYKAPDGDKSLLISTPVKDTTGPVTIPMTLRG